MGAAWLTMSWRPFLRRSEATPLVTFGTSLVLFCFPQHHSVTLGSSFRSLNYYGTDNGGADDRMRFMGEA